MVESHWTRLIVQPLLLACVEPVFIVLECESVGKAGCHQAAYSSRVVVVEILADSWAIEHNLDTQTPELCLGTDAGEQ